ncbi:MAG: phosphatidylserine/phosphatidylglycerophosphate/cardiolipin synthase family protein, partial [Desulfatibacillaceae bacterium]|nr:phosphatidylserine/phosphatidylglycerophosphate/cardiolipin synthase family protein [Desulfatibacillaceae bacterium]
GDYSIKIPLPRLLDAGEYSLPVGAEDSTDGKGFGQTTFSVIHKRNPSVPAIGSAAFNSQMEEFAGYPFRTGNKIEVLADGEAALNRRLEMIESARRQIVLQTFVLDRALAKGRFLDAVLAKVDEGVHVFMLLNADTMFPSSPLGALKLRVSQFFSELNRGYDRFAKEMERKSSVWSFLLPKAKKGGLHLAMFNGNSLAEKDKDKRGDRRTRDHWLDRMWRGEELDRQPKAIEEWLSSFGGPSGLPALPLLDYAIHEKILVVDGLLGVVGGRNLEDRYFTNWLDADWQIEGPVIEDMEQGFAKVFDEVAAPGILRPKVLHGTRPQAPNKGDLRAVYACSRPWNRRYGALLCMAHAVEACTKSFYGYSQFLVLPDSLLRDVILDAALRGVDVRLCINSPETAREVYMGLGFLLTLNYLEDLLRAGVRIFTVRGEAGEETIPQPYLHTKEFMFDSMLCACGSFNLSMRSSYMESENLVFVDDEKFTTLRQKAFLKFLEERTDEMDQTRFEAEKERFKTRMEMARMLDLLY